MLVTIGGHTYRSTVAVYGGAYMLPLSAANREATGVRASDSITVSIELDTAERTVTVPADLAHALDSGNVRQQFDALSYSKQRERVIAATARLIGPEQTDGSQRACG